jgi:glyoxylase-like metal-dependent hydrolase (beta-lactamase superfamily II)
MPGRARAAVGVLVGMTGVVVLGGLALAHRDIRRPAAPLPTVAEVVAARGTADGLPVELEAVDTASQAAPRGAVLDGARDPNPDAPYVMSHPAFLLTWGDGRRLLIDLGMDPRAAVSFSRAFTWIGADPVVTHGAAARQLAGRVESGLLGVVFTHLHTDHVQGVEALCRARGGAEVVLFQTRQQAERHNYTTRPGARLLAEADCLRPAGIPDGALAALPGYPGVFVVRAAGHTPGSQIVIAFVGQDDAVRTVVFTGDAVNAADGARHDVPKPLTYRLLVVPEDDARLGRLRRLLGRLELEAGAELAVAHDRLQLERLGLLPTRPGEVK